MHAIAAVVLLVPSRGTVEPLVSQPQSKIWIEGTSTIKPFQCTVPAFILTVNAEGPGATTATLAGKKAVSTANLTVPVAKLECGNGTMNEHLRKALKAEQNATIEFKLATYDVAKAADRVQGTLRGSLLLGGVEHPVAIAASASERADGALRVLGSYEVAMSDFDLEAPSLMFGRIKVGDKVRVRFDLVLKS
jgi:hypothetical protein